VFTGLKALNHNGHVSDRPTDNVVCLKDTSCANRNLTQAAVTISVISRGVTKHLRRR